MKVMKSRDEKVMNDYLYSGRFQKHNLCSNYIRFFLRRRKGVLLLRLLRVPRQVRPSARR